MGIFGDLAAQTKISGEVLDEKDSEPLIGASVLIEGTSKGTVTEWDGSFELDVDALPVNLVFSYTGYAAKTVTFSSAEKQKITLAEDAITIGVVEVKGRRISERQKQSALTVERLDNIAIKETAAANFYDGLGSLKDVDLTAASLGFKIVNTRGFNSTSPVRSLQIIDGIDNQSPGLNFSLGNFLGASELDVNSVDLIVGASSAFYGPNAFNGVISMETKNPFLHKGLSVQLKGGERNLLEGGIRWADAVKNKDGHDFFAYKLNFFYLTADDWQAENYSAVFDTETDESNPGGYDAVNIYGDEYENENDLSGAVSAFPGLGIFHRRGYREIDLVNYETKNTKASAAFHFRLQPEKTVESPELILSTSFGSGTTIYQGDNRFSLKNIRFYQHRLELKKYDTYFLRFYATHEDAGDSYDPYFTALKLQDRAKTNESNDFFFRSDYSVFWQSVSNQITDLEGYPSILDFLGRPDEFNAALNAFLSQPSVVSLISDLHAQADIAANMGNELDGTSDFYEPGSPQFQAAFDDITSTIGGTRGGTKFYDKSALVHGHGEYKFKDLVQNEKISDLDVIVGANARLYMPDTDGSLLLDTMGRNINTSEFGIYGGGTISFLDDALKVNTSIRLDKNQNFDALISPAASVVYTTNKNHVFRASFSSAIRNPTLNDQYLFYNVGPAILLGNKDGINNLVDVESLFDFFNTQNRDTLIYFDVAPIRPEKVKTFEVGYRATLFDKLYVDMGYYYSFYDDFIGYNIGVDLELSSFGTPTSLQAYRVAANAADKVTTQGFSIGTNYYFWNYFALTGNFSFNTLNTNSDDPIIPAFNTPKYKYNIGIAGRDISIPLGGKKIDNFGFNITYKWIDGFVFEGSPQFTGIIESYDLLDAQINWRADKINTTFKLGASNILNNLHYETYGGPLIGRLAYFSMLYEFKKK